MKTLLKQICKAHEPQGVILERLAEYYPDARIDTAGNIIGGGANNINTILTAHYDRVGFIVNYIDGDFARLTPLGGLDARVLPAQIVDIVGADGIYTAVICATPPHLSGDKADKPIELNDGVWADVLSGTDHIKLGDKAYFKPQFNTLLGSKVTGTALDNAAGVAAIFGVLEELTLIQKASTKVIFTVQEELGERGAEIAFYNEYAENATAIVFDTTFGADKNNDKTQTFALGKGAAVGISPILDQNTSISDKYQTEVMNGKTGTDADIISSTKGGIRTKLISIPLRNMHTPVEVVDIKDIESAVEYTLEVLGE
ncbi:MAG: M42 family peptidase [Oscillospiraceae bacterium]|jgi:endoglucanase|nr:M42 family peptidase [Oscillospiraceae bacterium]